MVRRLVALATAALLGAVMSLAVVAAPALAAHGWALFSWTPGFCIGAQNNSAASGAPIVSGIFQCGAYEWVPSQVGWYHIEQVDTHLCLNVKGGSKADKAQIIQYACVNHPNNDWLMIKMTSANGYDWYQWRNRNSQKCLNVPNGSTTAGLIIIQYTCSTTSKNNLWTWEPAW
jgi:hypothetical protein